MDGQQWGSGSIPGGNKKERRGKRAELPEDVAKKLKSCSVLNCEEWRDLNDTSTTYHCFPTGDKNQQRWEIWTSLLQKCRDDRSWIPFRGSLVCSHHFRPEDFVQDPTQKRRKLIKKAVPSIFPTFVVDLDDASFAIDDSNDATGEMDQGENDDSYYNSEYADQNGYDDDEQDPADMVFPEVSVEEYSEDEAINEDELQYVIYTQPQRQNKQQSTISTRPPLPRLTPANSYIRKSNESAATEPPKKKMSSNGIGNGSQQMQIMSQMHSTNVGYVGVSSSKKPPLTYKGASSNNNADIRFGTSNGTGTSNGRAFSNHSKPTFQNNNNNRSNNSSSSSKLYQQLCKSMPNAKFPMSWNSDLEIEVVQPNSSDSSTISLLKQRVGELETENETLKLKFSTQIRALQRTIKEQSKMINEYVAHFSSMGEEDS